MLPPSIFSTAFLISNKQEQLVNLAKELDGIIVLTNWYKKILLQNGFPNTKIILIKQGINPQFFLNEPIPVVQRNEKRLVFVGRITKVKGLHLLIDALKNIQHPIQLDIYGNKVDVDYFNACMDDAQKNKVDAQWKGLAAPNTMVQLLKNYDALVLPSYFSEMSPLVIQEAFLAGIPVIASNAYGNAEQITNGKNGLLFEFGNSTSLRDVIQDFYSKYSKTQWAITFSSNTFETVVEELDEAYNNVLNKHAVAVGQ